MSKSADGFVRSSPFVDGYHMERHPVATISDEPFDAPFDEAREEQRFADIVECLDLPRESRHRRYWHFRSAPFTAVPSRERALWWLNRLDIDAPDVIALDANILAPLIAARDGIDAALTDPQQRICDLFARRALFALASDSVREEITTTANQASLPAPVVNRHLNPAFIQAVLYGKPRPELVDVITELRGAVNAHINREVEQIWLQPGDDFAFLALLSSEPEHRFFYLPLVGASDTPPSDLSPFAAAAPECLSVLGANIGWASVREYQAFYERATRLLRGPQAAQMWYPVLGKQGSSAVDRWLRAHPEAIWTSNIPTQAARYLLPLVREHSTSTLHQVREQANKSAYQLIDTVMRERELPQLTDPGSWWDKTFTDISLRRKKLDGLGLVGLPPLTVNACALDKNHVTQLLQAMAAKEAGRPAVEAIAAHVDAVSGDDFATTLATLWLNQDAPAASAWMLTESAPLGGETFAATVIAQMDQWYWDGQHAKSLKGIQALGRTNSETALAYLLDLASSGPSSSARRREAMAQLSGIAQRRGMSVNRLEDRMLVDVAKPPVKRQKARFLHAMVAGENWPFEDFMTYVIRHPALKELTSGLIWGVYSGPNPDAELRISFIVDEEGRALDVDDAVIDIAADENIRVIHPMQLSEDEREAWLQVLADDELVPPFDQLSRPVFTLTQAEAEATSLSVVPAKEVAPKRLNGILIKHGWERGRAGSGGYISAITLPVASAGCTVVMILSEPGLHAMPSTDSTKICVREVCATDAVLPIGTLTTERDEVHALPRQPWSIVPRTVISEVLATMHAL